ncbi:hypothetical protein AAF712_014019 [Marasmius tenuissimus]|uniref:Uncharacterized protein n=1 Tax=Marasmius tenuissimus TaxID=585030 RepID=A0ABR2ZC66_9AGAR
MSDNRPQDTTSSPPFPGPETGYYGPQEPYELVLIENADFAGNLVGGICYGIIVVLVFQCAAAVLSSSNKNMRIPMLIYVAFMFALGTIFTALNLNGLQDRYIQFRNFPEGGPLGYGLSQFSSWRSILANTVYIVSNWLADGLLIYRCFVIWNRRKAILVFPMIMFGGSISMGVITLYKSSSPGSNLWSEITVDFALPYFTISVALNVLLTLIICFRLLWHSRLYNLAASPSKGSYRRIVAMLVESCALYALFSVLFIGTYASGNYMSNFFLPVLSQVQIISPFLIIMRVAHRRSVTDNVQGSSGTYRGGGSSGFQTTLQAASRTTNPTPITTQIAMVDMVNGDFGKFDRKKVVTDDTMSHV